MRKFLAIAICLLAVSCSGGRKISLDTVTMEEVNGTRVHLRDSAGHGLLILVFMSPDCPLCINYTRTVTELQTEFRKDGVRFFVVFPGDFYAKEEILRFYDAYQFTVTGLLDPGYAFTREIGATVTPEAFMLNGEGEILYSGAIDNWMYETGKKRATITRHYLKDAITSVLNNREPDPEYTEPVGCYIEL